MAGQRWIAEHDGLEPLHAGFEPWRLGESKRRHDLEVQETQRGLRSSAPLGHTTVPSSGATAWNSTARAHARERPLHRLHDVFPQAGLLQDGKLSAQGAAEFARVDLG